MQRWLPMWVLAGLSLVIAGCEPSEDYSTPKSAVKSLYYSLALDKPENAKGAVVDQIQADVVVELKDLLKSVLAAQDAAVEKFGKPGKGVSGGLPSLDDIDAAQQTVEGDKAELAVTGMGKKLKLRRIAGKWKVDAFSLLGINPPNADTARKMITAATEAVRDVSAKIKAGHYKSAEEAQVALDMQVKLAVLIKTMGLGG